MVTQMSSTPLWELRKRGCISNWFPKIEAAGLLVPKTEIVKCGISLYSLCDGEKPEGFESFIEQLSQAISRIGMPVFLRTGQTSAKHYWDKTCRLTDLSRLSRHIAEIVDFSLCVDLVGLDIDVWVVREMLPTAAAFYAFAGNMPITKERRYFVEGDTVLCAHPYWPEEAFVSRYEGGNDHARAENWRELLRELNHDTEADVEELRELTKRVGRAVEGAWSVDWLWTRRGWHLTDMAPAESSYHWAGCPNEKLCVI